MFITWISQLVALLDKGEGAAIHDILISLATDYPQALYYPFKISSCNFKFERNETGRANQEAVSRYGLPYAISWKFSRVLIFAVFKDRHASTKINTHENACACMRVHARILGVA